MGANRCKLPVFRKCLSCAWGRTRFVVSVASPWVACCRRCCPTREGTAPPTDSPAVTRWAASAAGRTYHERRRTRKHSTPSARRSPAPVCAPPEARCPDLTRLHTHTRLTALFPGPPRWAGTRKVKPIWILLKQETVSGSGISWAICKSASRSRQDNHASTPTL